MGKRHLKLCEHLNRMEETQITKKTLFSYINKLKKTVEWIEAVKEDVNIIGITE